MNPTILIIDDDRFLVRSLERLLERQGCIVQAAYSALDGLQLAAAGNPDLIILDLGLPDSDGIGVCRRLRDTHTVPILILSSRAETADKVTGLEVGADDYLTKPFDPSELAARVKALLRRSAQSQGSDIPQGTVEHGPLKIDIDSRCAFISGEPLHLTPIEFSLLSLLASKSGKAYSRDTLYNLIWGYSADCSTNSLDVVIYRLRSKLKVCGMDKHLETVRGFGFRFGTGD